MKAQSLRMLCPVLALLVAGWPAAAGAQEADAGPDPDALSNRLWLEFGAGVGQLAFDSSQYADSGTGLSLEVLAGARLTPRWSVGLAAGAVGIKPSNRNYNAYDYGSSIWGESITNVRLLVQCEPRRDNGWFYAGGVGLAYYHNKPLEDLAGKSGGRIGKGNEFMLRFGYDWPKGPRSHVQASLGVDTGHVSLDAPLSGSFQYTAVSANVAVAFR